MSNHILCKTKTVQSLCKCFTSFDSYYVSYIEDGKELTHSQLDKE